jgi:hypothetical protein
MEAVVGFELKALSLLGSHCAIWVIPFLHFGLVIFQRGFHIFAQSGLRPVSSYLFLLVSWDYRYLPPNLAQVFLFDKVTL